MVTNLGKAVRVHLYDRGEVGRRTAMVTQRSRGKDSDLMLIEHMGWLLQTFSCSILIQVPEWVLAPLSQMKKQLSNVEGLNQGHTNYKRQSHDIFFKFSP